MNCGYGEKLMLYHFGEAEGRLRGEVEGHLAGCPACRAELAALRLAGGRLAAEEAAPSERVFAAVMAAARAGRAGGWLGLRGWRDSLLAGALASALALGFSLTASPSRQDLAWNSGIDTELDVVEYSIYSAQADLVSAGDWADDFAG